MSRDIQKLVSVHGSFEERVHASTGLTLREFDRTLRSRFTSKLVALSVHNNCNQSCYHCFQRENEPSRKVNLEDIAKILDSFDSTIYRKYLFPKEPLLLPELIPFYQRIGCAEISTNATLLAKKPEFLKLLRDHGIGLLFVSLHGNQQEHCRLTGVQPSVYTELLESLAYIVKSGFHLEVVTTLYKGNVGALDSLPELLIDIGVSKWWIQRIMPAGYARNWDPSEFLYSEECKEVLFKYAQLKNRFNPTQLRVGLDLTWGPNFYSQRMLKFLAGQVQDWPWTRFACPAVSENSVVISMDSKKAYPCLFFESFPEASIGEIRSDLYVETRDSPFSEEKLLNKLRGQCSECLYKAYCLGGCRAVAFSFAMLRGAEEPFYAGQDFCLTHWIEQELD